MISGSLPGLADSIVENLVSGLVDRESLAELQSAADSRPAAVSWHNQVGELSGQVHSLHTLGHMSLVSGSMAGSITRLLLSDTTSGRP